MLDIQPQSLQERLLRIINFSDYFLAAYTTPYHVIIDGINKVFDELREVYLDVSNNNISTTLLQLPPIQILEFFAALVYAHYSYEFFYKAIEENILKYLEDNSLTVEDKAYNLFFLSIVCRSLHKENPFNKLLQNIPFQNIPLTLKFGILYEIDYVKKHSKELRKIRRKVQDSLKKSSQLHDNALKIHDVPMKKLIKK